MAMVQPRCSLSHPIKVPRVQAIAPEQLDLGKELLDWLQQGLGSLLVGAVGTGDLDRQQIPLRIHQHVAFAAPDFFSPRRSPFQVHAPHWF